MPQIKKEMKSCHDCGLESLGDCEENRVHRSVDAKSPPCKFCVRNRYSNAKTVTDFYSENWVLSLGLDGHYSPSFEEQNPHERLLLTLFHATET